MSASGRLLVVQLGNKVYLNTVGGLWQQQNHRNSIQFTVRGESSHVFQSHSACSETSNANILMTTIMMNDYVQFD